MGQRLQVKGRWMRVAGVAKVSKYRSLLELPKPFFYVPLRQNFSINLNLNIRTTLAREVRAARRDPGGVRSDHHAGRSRSVLAAIGQYGVMSCAVSQSKRELGLRMALGADSPALSWLLMWSEAQPRRWN